MKTKIGMKCKACGHWNIIEVENIMLNPDSHEPKAQVFLPSYYRLKLSYALSVEA